LQSMAITMPEVKGHPNRAAFRGVLTVVDATSQRAPSGSGGRRVLLTKDAAEAALASLLGMALDYAPSFDRHDTRRKVGVITRAELVGRNLEVGGHLFARDFPEVVAEIRKAAGSGMRAGDVRPRTSGVGLAGSIFRPRLWKFGRWMSASARALRKRGTSGVAERHIGVALSAWSGGSHPGGTLAAAGSALGMSYEITGAQIIDTRAKVWILTSVTFTGAAILRRDKAAYQDTWIELA